MSRFRRRQGREAPRPEPVTDWRTSLASYCGAIPSPRVPYKPIHGGYEDRSKILDPPLAVAMTEAESREVRALYEFAKDPRSKDGIVHLGPLMERIVHVCRAADRMHDWLKEKSLRGPFSWGSGLVPTEQRPTGAGDYDEVCVGCEMSVSTPHRYDVCSAGLRLAQRSAIDMVIDCEQSLKALVDVWPKCYVHACGQTATWEQPNLHWATDPPAVLQCDKHKGVAFMTDPKELQHAAVVRAIEAVKKASREALKAKQ